MPVLWRMSDVDQPEDQDHPAEASIAVRCSDAAGCRVIEVTGNACADYRIAECGCLD
jgi:hypothetical protein